MAIVWGTRMHCWRHISRRAVAARFFFMVSAVTVICGVGISESRAWWFGASDENCVPQAVQSTSPKKVATCLERQIRAKNYSGILQLRKHARDMIRRERNKVNTSQGITPEQLNKNIASWVRIETRATEFYKAVVQ